MADLIVLSSDEDNDDACAGAAVTGSRVHCAEEGEDEYIDIDDTSPPAHGSVSPPPLSSLPSLLHYHPRPVAVSTTSLC